MHHWGATLPTEITWRFTDPLYEYHRPALLVNNSVMVFLKVTFTNHELAQACLVTPPHHVHNHTKGSSSMHEQTQRTPSRLACVCDVAPLCSAYFIKLAALLPVLGFGHDVNDATEGLVRDAYLTLPDNRFRLGNG